MMVKSLSGAAIVIGTRPEAIKVAPIFRELRLRNYNVSLILSGQQRDLARSMLADLHIAPDFDLDLMEVDQTPLSITSRIIDKLPEVLNLVDAEDILVQGDTTTAFAAAYVGYMTGRRVSHVEAGLRTGDHQNPFPEEGNRKLIGQIADLHFAPTVTSRDNLMKEGIRADSIFVVGNTAIDTLHQTLDSSPPSKYATNSCPYLLVTLHRRESFGRPLIEILNALEHFLEVEPSAEVLWPLHPNPRVREVVVERFAHSSRIRLLEPQPYREFVHLLANASLVLTDSGGIQEEGPSLGKVVLVARELTERPEGLTSGMNQLVGRSSESVFRGLVNNWGHSILASTANRSSSPFGDGNAARRIVAILDGRHPDPFQG